jgi:hypothetical protein
MRIGIKMQAVVDFVKDHPGCCKLAAASEVAPNGSLRYGYRTVNRTIGSGLIKAERLSSGVYQLFPCT